MAMFVVVVCDGRIDWSELRWDPWLTTERNLLFGAGLQQLGALVRPLVELGLELNQSLGSVVLELPPATPVACLAAGAVVRGRRRPQGLAGGGDWHGGSLVGRLS
jgi:hypothetical protein